MRINKLSIILIALNTLLLVGCSSADDYDTKATYNSAASIQSLNTDSISGFANYAETAEVSYEDDIDSGYTISPEEEFNTDINDSENITSEITLLEEKLVYRCDMTIETLDYEGTIQNIKSLLDKYDGIIQSEREYDRSDGWYYSDYVKRSGTLSNTIEIRVPSKNYENLLNEVGENGKVISKSTSIDNISQSYYDKSTEVKALKIEEDRLLQMMEKCDTISDMIEVEQRLSEVQSKINSLTTDIKYMDMDVAYSYVNITVNEVVEYTPDETPIKINTFLDRLKNTIHDSGYNFLETLESLLLLVIKLLPYILLIVIIIVVYKLVLSKKIQVMRSKKGIKKSVKLTDINKLVDELSDKEQEMNNKEHDRDALDKK